MTLEEFFRANKNQKELAEEMANAIKNQQLEAFFQAHNVDATKEDLIPM